MLDLKRKEEELVSYWKENQIEDRVRAKNKEGKKFYFLDGPPYASGELASHHIWVFTIKDMVLRYKRYRGFNVHDRGGFDVHGLPIENKVERSLNLKSKYEIEHDVGVEKFVDACKAYADEQVEKAIHILKRFGVSLDYENVYIPHRNEYISRGWGIFKKMYERGLLYKDGQPLAYCPHCETTLSAQGPEVEYEDENDPSVFIRFKIDASKDSKISLREGSYLVIWTTTPWTLPSNMAIAVNPKAIYVNARFGEENYIVAKERLDDLARALGSSSIIESEFYGGELEGTYYISPLEEKVPKQKEYRKYHRILISESFVNINEGTGLLHVAPGHGPEDYKLCRPFKIPTFSPVDDHAKYTEEAGIYVGLSLPLEANKRVLSDLKENGSLLFHGTINHSYPHCWRCSSKLIYRATDQWFIDIQKIKKKMLSENERIAWFPENAKGWFADAIESSPDWCISRQRYWGAPIPIWICSSCKNMDVIGSIDELVEKAGLESKPEDLHKPHIDRIQIKCNKCGEKMERVKDIFDVWYDSGIAHTASLSDGEFSKLFPADWITESRDQIRGWFSVLLRTSVAVYGKRSFNRVTIGGILKDELGREMHRHLGNTTSSSEVLGISSGDGYRLWCASHPRWLELKLKRQSLDDAYKNIITLYNIGELAKELKTLAEISDKKVKKPSAKSLENEDLWIVSRLNSLIESFTLSMEDYKLDVAVNELRKFIVEDFSRFYLKFIKQRASTASKKELKKLYGIVSYILYNTVVISSIVIPFASESIYLELFGEEGGSVFLKRWPNADKKLINRDLEEEFEVFQEAAQAVLNERERKGVKLRWPVKEVVIKTSRPEVADAIRRLTPLMEAYANAKEVKVVESETSKKRVRPIFQRLGPSFKGSARLVADALLAADAMAVENELRSSGKYLLHTTNGTFEVYPEHLSIYEDAIASSGLAFKYGIVDVDATSSEELKKEVVSREFIRRVQLMRKEMKLTKLDNIKVYLAASDEILSAIRENEKEILGVVRADSISQFDESEREVVKKEWDILGDIVSIGIKMITGAESLP